MLNIKLIKRGGTMARTKWTIEKAKEEFEKEGYVLLEEEYINSNTNKEINEIENILKQTLNL